MIKTVIQKYKNIIIKVVCYIVIVSILLVCFNFNFHNLFRKESSLVSAQVGEELMEVVTNDSYEILGQVERKIPQTFGQYSKDEYPSSLNVLKEVDQIKRESIYNENLEMYDDIENAINENRLKKHVSADGQFWGNVSDSAKGIVKKTYVNASVKRRHSLGVYAPAGEVLTIEIGETLVNKGLVVTIGYEVDANMIPLEKFLDGNEDRMPLISKTFALTSTTTKVGTPLGGAVYVSVPDSLNDNFEIIVSGGVDNPVFQLGVNTEEDYLEMLETPGLIMEFKLPHARLIMPKSYALKGEIIPALKLWHKMSSLSSYAMNRTANTLPISQYYDSYIPVGAACAYVWGWFSILPLSWGTNALDYKLMMESGSWGNFHELNHHYQSMNYSSGKWGLDNPDEVTNNVLTTMGYLLYTDIASTRSETNEPGDGGWNVSSDPYYNFKKVLNVSNSVNDFSEFGTNQLYMYADLMHAFGTDKVMELIRASYGLMEGYQKDLMSDIDSFALRASKVLKSDLTYYLTEICKMKLQEETVTAIKNMNYEPYLPLYNLYSNGIKGVNSGRAFYLNDSEYLFNFNEYTISPLNYKIKEISRLKYGRLRDNGEGLYFYSNKYLKKEALSVTYSIEYNGKEYLKTLDFEIDFRFDNVHYKSYSTTSYDIDGAIGGITSNNLIYQRYNYGLNYNALDGHNLTVVNGRLKVDKSGNYIFAIYGDDQVRFKLDNKEANIIKHSRDINLEDDKTFFTIYLKEGEFYDFSLYCLNTGGIGSASVVYSYENENNFISIDDDFIYSTIANDENVGKIISDYPLLYDVSKSLLANKYGDSTINKIESIETNANSNGDTFVENMFDGNKANAFHTAWQRDITPFPHEYIIKFEETALFDNINIYFTNNDTYYAIGQYEVYMSNDGASYKLIKEGSNDAGFLNINFNEQYKAKYIKLVVKSNVSNKLFTSISEIEVGIKSNFNNLNYYASNNENLHYEKEWELHTTGNHFNGVYAVANKGSKVEFYFTGSELSLYMKKDSKYKVKIDNSKWITVTNSSSENNPSYIVKDLKNKKHKVVIEVLNDETGIEMIGINGEINERNIYVLGFVEFYKIVGSIAIAVFLIQGLLYLQESKIISKTLNSIKEKMKEKL